MNSHWHPDLQIRKLEDWLVEARMVYAVQPVPYQRWLEFNTLRDGLEINDHPIFFLGFSYQAVKWALDYLIREDRLAYILAHWHAEPSHSTEQQLNQLRELAKVRSDGQSGLERLYELLIVCSGPFRPWSQLQGLRPYIEV